MPRPIAKQSRQVAGRADQARRMRPHAEAAADLLKAIGNPQRLMILCNLAGGELTVGELTERLQLGQSATSQHLAVLREHRAVATRREAQAVFYSLRAGSAARIVAVLHDIFCAPPPSAAVRPRR